MCFYLEQKYLYSTSTMYLHNEILNDSRFQITSPVPVLST
jgi:hypothetical protein